MNTCYDRPTVSKPAGHTGTNEPSPANKPHYQPLDPFSRRCNEAALRNLSLDDATHESLMAFHGNSSEMQLFLLMKMQQMLSELQNERHSLQPVTVPLPQDVPNLHISDDSVPSKESVSTYSRKESASESVPEISKSDQTLNEPLCPRLEQNDPVSEEAAATPIMNPLCPNADNIVYTEVNFAADYETPTSSSPVPPLEKNSFASNSTLEQKIKLVLGEGCIHDTTHALTHN